MIFNDKIQAFFQQFETVPSPKEPKHLKHLYADFVELIALFYNGDYVTSTHILKRLLGEDKHLIGENDIEAIENGISFDEIASANSEIQDRDEGETDDIFDILKNRTQIFSATYPFGYSNHGLKLKENLDNKQKLYLGLLIASNLNIFGKVQPEITREFEAISFQAIQNFMPSHAIKKQFGKNSAYSGSAKEKIAALAKDMNLELNKFEFNQISERNNQEKGLDLIAWIPFENKCQNILVLLAQCACGKKWYSKSNETRRYESYLHFYKLAPIHSLFIPYALLDSDGKFFQSDEIREILLFERSHILEYIIDTSFFESLDTKTFVEACIAYQESLV